MPDCTVVVSGTSTGVGKTHVASRLARALMASGLVTAARKPVLSCERTSGSTDAEVLAAATGEDPLVVCPAHRRYAMPMAPPVAAELLGKPPFTIADLVAELSLGERGVAIVEGAGGPRSPLATDGDTVSLADALDADAILLVADSGLGALNAVLLAVDVFGGRDVVVFLNRFRAADAVHVTNLRWLTQRSKLEVVTDIEGLAARLTQRMEPTAVEAS